MTGEVIELYNPTDGANSCIALSEPYTVVVTLEGSSDLLFHRWNCESVEAKSKAAKGSKAKKTDDLESFVYRNEEGEICLPSEYVRQAIINAAKYRQDPRSPRKSAMDLTKASVVSDLPLVSLGKKDWDYVDTRRVTIQRNGINRSRPAMKAGWVAKFQFTILTPEYFPQQFFHEILIDAGKLVGVGDFRPTYGRFLVTSFEILQR